MPTADEEIGNMRMEMGSITSYRLQRHWIIYNFEKNEEL